MLKKNKDNTRGWTRGQNTDPRLHKFEELENGDGTETEYLDRMEPDHAPRYIHWNHNGEMYNTTHTNEYALNY